jgi:iron complex transport system substrate-binding protein
VKIVSLLPGATETIVALGAADALVGISHSCDDPAVAELPRVTRSRVPVGASSGEVDRVVRECLDRRESLYAIDVERLAALEPDLIITQGLCDVCAVTGEEVDQALYFVRTTPRVLSSEPRTVAQVLDSILEIGNAIGRDGAALDLVHRLRERVRAVQMASTRPEPKPRVAFLEWLDPPMCGGHWNPELVAMAGGLDGIGRPGEPSRSIRWSELIRWRPDLLCVACCGNTADRTGAELAEVLRARRDLAGLPCARNGRIHVFDGVGLFARPGPRIVESFEALAGAITACRS